MYRILKEAYDSIEIEKDLLRKTSKLVQYHTKPGKIKATLEIYEINSNALRKIEESKDPDNKKVFNISKSILKHVQDHANTSPYLLSIGEKAEAIIKLYKARQKSTEETLEELKKLIDEINSARKAEKEKKMPSDTFSIYWMLQKTNVPEPEDKAKIMGEVLRKYPHWKESEKQEREVKIQFITILLNSGIDVQEAGEKARAIMRVIKGGL